MGESSASAKPSDEIWAKLGNPLSIVGVKFGIFVRYLFLLNSFFRAVQSDLRYRNVEIRSDEGEILLCSEISANSSDKHIWCKIARNSDLCSAKIENKR
jgi:hypothetical protein